VARFRYIVLPALKPTLLAVACLVTIYSMRAFDMIFALTQGGPLDSSNVLPLLSYQFSFQQFKFGIGAAVGTFAVVFVFAVALGLCTHLETRGTRMTGGSSSFLSHRTRRIAFSVLGFAGVAIYLFPIYWMLISGFKSSAEIFVNPPTFFPKAPNLDAFHSVFVQENIARYLRNSVIIAVPVTLLTLALGSMGAYAMSRIRSRLVDVALVAVLLLQVFPEALIATPIFIIFNRWGFSIHSRR
jgi:ABC-type glycerol-3-phosphate transport system permease component